MHQTFSQQSEGVTSEAETRPYATQRSFTSLADAF